jgi:hypothetical protein
MAAHRDSRFCSSRASYGRPSANGRGSRASSYRQSGRASCVLSSHTLPPPPLTMPLPLLLMVSIATASKPLLFCVCVCGCGCGCGCACDCVCPRVCAAPPSCTVLHSFIKLVQELRENKLPEGEAMRRADPRWRPGGGSAAAARAARASAAASSSSSSSSASPGGGGAGRVPQNLEVTMLLAELLDTIHAHPGWGRGEIQCESERASQPATRTMQPRRWHGSPDGIARTGRCTCTLPTVALAGVPPHPAVWGADYVEALASTGGGGGEAEGGAALPGKVATKGGGGGLRLLQRIDSTDFDDSEVCTHS